MTGDQSSFQDWISGLNAQKAGALAQALFDCQAQAEVGEVVQFDFTALNTLLESEKEKDEFQSVLNAYRIEFIGGRNSLNFLVVDVLTEEKEVLKLENRLGHSKDQNKTPLNFTGLEDTLAKVLYDMPVSIIGDRHGHSARGLQMVEHCGFSIEDYAYDEEMSIEDRLEMAGDIYPQMANVLQIMQKNGMFQPDAKNSNWLIKNGTLKIADTKALIPRDFKGEMSINRILQEGYPFIQSPLLTPPECSKGKANPDDTFDPSKVEIYMIGKNMYQFLTSPMEQDEEDAFAEVTDGKQFNFSAAIFQTPKGKMFADLIRSCVKENPMERINVAQVQQALSTINNFKEVQFNQLQTAAKDDEHLKEIISTMHQKLPTQNSNAIQTNHGRSIKEELRQSKEAFQQSRKDATEAPEPVNPDNEIKMGH